MRGLTDAQAEVIRDYLSHPNKIYDDQPGEITPSLVELGYVVISNCWHPDGDATKVNVTSSGKTALMCYVATKNIDINM